MCNKRPEVEQSPAYELLRRLVLAWDPDFTKLTPMERAELESARADFENGNAVRVEDIDWG